MGEGQCWKRIVVWEGQYWRRAVVGKGHHRGRDSDREDVILRESPM